jgi:hypothetical protein
MKTLRTLSAAIALTLVLGISALAGETQTPPCAPAQPGEVSTPPCAMAQAPTLGEMNTPPAADKALTLTEIAANVLQSMWSLF